jgi:hypothetical protein
MRLIIGVFFLLACESPLIAAEKVESFYKKQIDSGWTVHGTSYPVDSNKPPACFANTGLSDGSIVQITVLPTTFGDRREAHPQGTKLVIRNMQWAIAAKVGKRLLHMNLYNGQTVVRELDVAFNAEDKNTVVVPELSRDFYTALSQANRIILTMRDDDASAVLTFSRPQEIVKALYDCSWKYESIYNE